ncbi:hypothetical protein DFJ73DRAFT_838527 [Zopfochytrium polystomum]|nr:hypothetical protein DFJ73DRAFT_838527 [Zopfochytrium polystomum]
MADSRLLGAGLSRQPPTSSSSSLSASVRLSDHLPLAPTPFSGLVPAASIQQLIAATPNRSSSSDSGNKRPTAAAAVTALPFLCESVAEGYARGSHEWILTTVQSNGVYLHNVDTQHCILSFSVAPGVVMSAPARFIPSEAAQPSEQQQLEAELGLDPSVEAEEPKPKVTGVSGRAYLPIAYAPSLSQSQIRRQIWVFEADSRGGDFEEQTPGKPSTVRTMESEIQRLFVQDGHLLVVLASGKIQVFRSDLGEPVASWRPSAKSVKTIWSSFDVATGMLCRVLSADDHFDFVCIKSTVNVDGTFVLESVRHVALDLNSPESCTINKNSSKLTVKDGLDVKIYDVSRPSPSGNSPLKPETTLLSLSTTFDDHRIVRMEAIGDSHVALVGTRKSDSAITRTVLIIDTEYGTVQAEAALSRKPGSSEGLSFSIGQLSSVSMGPLLCVAASDYNREGSSLSFLSKVRFVPFYCPPMSLMAAIGRSSVRALDDSALAALSSASPAESPRSAQLAREKLDQEYLVKLFNPEQSPTEVAMSDIFIDWIISKGQALSKSKKGEFEESTSRTVASLPIVEISHPIILGILTRCLLRPLEFWPAKVIKYLIKTGLCPSRFSPVRDVAEASLRALSIKGEAAVVPDQLSLVDAIIERNDVEVLTALLDRKDSVVDVLEFDLARLISFVCCTTEMRSGEAERGDLQKRREDIDRKANYRGGGERRATDDGRYFFLEKIFSWSRSDSEMAAEMRAGLGVAEVEVLLDWAAMNTVDTHANSGQDMDVDGKPWADKKRKALWWMWEKKRADRMVMAIDVLALLLDSHTTTILLAPALTARLAELQKSIDEDAQTMSIYQRNLTGFLSTFHIPEKKSGPSRKDEDQTKMLHKRWNRMVKDVNDGVGKYAVEVIQF